ncbi:C40 family peptidase, partial [Escherichia coli]|uniref:C40 family peptidase n=1 Tax=Escherichia coli TaxID=562 RepID=UPI00207662CC
MTQTESAILVHARRCAPAESCGFVIGTPEGERYQPCVNISAEPEAYFRIAPEDWLQAEMQGEIVALVHSHPGGLPWLSEADRRLQIKSALPWWLVCRGEIHKFRCCLLYTTDAAGNQLRVPPSVRGILKNHILSTHPHKTL